MDDRESVVGQRMERFARVGVDLNANAEIFLSQSGPEMVQPTVIEDKAANVRLVLRMHNFRDSAGLIPGADQENLTFAPTATAATEMRECLIKDAAWEAVYDSHYPPLTVLGRSSNTSCGFTPDASMV